MFSFFEPKNDVRPWNRNVKKGLVKSQPTRFSKEVEVPSWQRKSRNTQANWRAKNKKRDLELLEIGKDSYLEIGLEERPKRLPLKRLISLVVLCAVFILSLLILVELQIKHNKLGLNISQLTNRKVTLIDENRRYRAEMDNLMIVGDLEQVARETLGLVSPTEGQIIIIP